MKIGSLSDMTLAEMAGSAGHDFLKIWLSVEGPEHILAWAATKDPRIDWEDLYNHHCDACRAIYQDPRVRAVLARHWHERRDDILSRYRLAHDRTRPVVPEETTAVISI